MTVAQGQGAMSKGDEIVANAALGASSKWADNSAAYDLAKKKVQQGFENHIGAIGSLRVREDLRQNAKGELVRQYVPTGGRQDLPTGPKPPPASFKRAGQ